MGGLAARCCGGAPEDAGVRAADVSKHGSGLVSQLQAPAAAAAAPAAPCARSRTSTEESRFAVMDSFAEGSAAASAPSDGSANKSTASGGKRVTFKVEKRPSLNPFSDDEEAEPPGTQPSPKQTALARLRGQGAGQKSAEPEAKLPPSEESRKLKSTKSDKSVQSTYDAPDGSRVLQFGTRVKKGEGNFHGCYFDLVNLAGRAVQVQEFRLGTRAEAGQLRLFARRTPARCRGSEKNPDAWEEMGCACTANSNESVQVTLNKPLTICQGATRGLYIHSASPVALGEPGFAEDENLRAEHAGEAKAAKPFVSFSDNTEYLPAGACIYRIVEEEPLAP